MELNWGCDPITRIEDLGLNRPCISSKLLPYHKALIINKINMIFNHENEAEHLSI